jgi:hypothetical protein
MCLLCLLCPMLATDDLSRQGMYLLHSPCARRSPRSLHFVPAQPSVWCWVSFLMLKHPLPTRRDSLGVSNVPSASVLAAADYATMGRNLK